ncbi:hypothetical protein, partial [Xanthomonas arboricola]|uniref:hypothetical protein n=1 Tax=Xanthomonas arboricola TaxID=56448 RepID=UPI0012DB2ECC
HPHISDGVALVHNGIIENHEQQREKLRALGYTFESPGLRRIRPRRPQRRPPWCRSRRGRRSRSRPS